MTSIPTPAPNYSSETRKRRFVSECVVGLAGLEPPTRPLWRDAPAPRTPQWDIFDWPGQEERACDVGTVEPMPEPGMFRRRAVGATAWSTSDCCSHDSESL